MKFNDTLMLCVRRDLDNGLIPMLLGEPGIGKSSWLTNLANLMHTKCFTLACNQLADKADLTGARLVPTDNGEYKQVFYPHAVIHDAIEYAIAHPRETPILFLDELNRTTPMLRPKLCQFPRCVPSVPRNCRPTCVLSLPVMTRVMSLLWTKHPFPDLSYIVLHPIPTHSCLWTPT